MTRHAVLTAIAVTVIGAGTFAATSAFAQSSTNEDPKSSLVQKIADKFGLNKSDVQAVFDQERGERQVKMKVDYRAQLDQYVKNGKITEAQKQLILDKRDELEANRQTKMQEMQKMTDTERKSAMQKEKQALQEWAKQNGIDLMYLMPHGPGRGHGLRMDMKKEMPSATASPTSAQ